MWPGLVGYLLCTLVYVVALLWPGLAAWLQEEDYEMTDAKRLDIMYHNLLRAYPNLGVVRDEACIVVYHPDRSRLVLTPVDYSDEEEQVAIWLA